MGTNEMSLSVYVSMLNKLSLPLTVLLLKKKQTTNSKLSNDLFFLPTIFYLTQYFELALIFCFNTYCCRKEAAMAMYINLYL